MSDEAWRAHERRWRQDPADLDALGRAIAGLRRSGLLVPPDLLDARVEPATRLETALPLEVWAVLPGEREPTTVGWGPGTIEVPPHRYWGVGDVPAGRAGLGWLGDELRRRAIPGLRLPQLAPSRRRVVAGRGDDDPHLDPAGLDALGPQPQLRWLDLPRRGVQWVTPGEVVRSLRCAGLEVFRGEFLVGDGRADEDGEETGSRLEGFEALVHLREVELADCELVVDDLRALAGLPELDAVTVTGSQLGLSHLLRAGLGPRLRGLQLDVPLDDADVTALGSVGGLTRLRAGFEHLSPGRASGLTAALPRLQALELSAAAGAFDEALPRLTSLPLNRLVLVGGSGRLGDAGLAAVRSIPTLRAFEGGVAHEHAAPLAASDFRPLESLDLQCGGTCWPALARAERLRALWLLGGAADEALDAVGALPALERLSLSVGRASRPRTLHLPRLASLELRDPLTSTELQAPLRSLRLRRERRPGSFHGTEGSLAGLERLELLTGLGDADLAPLKGLQSLRVLELHLIDRIGSDLPDRVLELLRALPALRRVHFGAGSGAPGSLAEAHRVARGWIADELPWVAVLD